MHRTKAFTDFLVYKDAVVWLNKTVTFIVSTCKDRDVAWK